MYEIKLNDTIIHEPDPQSKRKLSAGSFVEDINKIPSFTFTIPAMNPIFLQELHDRKDIITITNTLTGETEFEGHLLTHTNSMSTSGRFAVKAVAEGFLGYLCDSIQMYHTYTDTLPADFLTALLDAHNAQVTANGHPEKRIVLGLVDVTRSDYKRSKTTAYRNTLEEIQVNLIDRIGGEIRIRNVNGALVLDYLETIGVTCSTKIELAKNMKSLQVETDSSNIITRLIPLGYQPNPGDSAERLTISSVNSGLPYIDDANGIAQYGIIAGTVIFDDITQPANLKTAGQEYLTNNNRIRKAYEAQALDLSVLDTSQQALRCGNTYTFVNDFVGVNEALRLVGRTVDINKPYTPTLRIGDKSVKITDIATHTAKLIEYEMPKQKQEILESAKSIATDIINAGINGHVVVNGNEILIMDTDNKDTARNVWRYNLGGWGVSHNGYNGPFTMAATLDGGFVADFITAGVLRGLEILNGNGTFHVYPNGSVDASAINITGGSINITTNSETYDVIQLSCGAWTHKLAPLEWILSNSDTGCEIRAQAGSIFFKMGGYNMLTLDTTTGRVYSKDICYTDSNDNLISVKDQITAIWSEIQNIWDAIAAYHPVGGNS